MSEEGEQRLLSDDAFGEEIAPPELGVGGRNDWPPHLPSLFYVALEEFNLGDYFQCHETLEALWIPEKRSVRELYQGVLQIAVGCYHLTQRANRGGAVNLLERGARRLERTGAASFSPERDMAAPQERQEAVDSLYGVDWRGLIAAANRLQAHLRQLDRPEVADYDRALLPIIVFSVVRSFAADE